MKRLYGWILALCAAVTLIAGCGGGGGGSAGPSGGVNIFATDDLTATYSQVWVKLYKLELRKTDDTYVTVFSDPDGRVMDLRKLNDGSSSKYAFLGTDSVPQGSYVGARSTLDRLTSLVPTGSSTAQSRQFDDSYGTSQTVLITTFATTVVVDGVGSDNVILDFDLAAWTIGGNGKIQNALCDQGNGVGFGSGSNHERDDFKGAIADLEGTAPNQTFILSTRAGNKMVVTTDSATTIFNNSAAPNPTLANGKHVEVRGVYDPSTGNLLATTIKIKSSSDDDDFEAKGAPHMANAASRTFKVTVREAEGFLPTGTQIDVVVNDSTRFFSDRGVQMTEAEFFALLPLDGGIEVEVEGSVFDANTQTLTAKKCKIEDEDGHGKGDVEASGAPTAINLGEGTFGLTLSSWEGFNSSAGTVVTVETDGGTEYKDADGENVSQSQFFTLLATATAVKVEGAYSEGVITAREAKIRTSAGGGGNDPDEIQGSVSLINAGAGTFTVSIIDWFGFNGTPGQLIAVTMSVSATYRNDNGESITKEQFFAALSNGALVEVDGTVSGSVMTGVKAKLDDD